ncbi:GSCOCG00007549001-RA-CDS, partial [Cotesia congregata]
PVRSINNHRPIKLSLDLNLSSLVRDTGHAPLLLFVGILLLLRCCFSLSSNKKYMAA